MKVEEDSEEEIVCVSSSAGPIDLTAEDAHPHLSPLRWAISERINPSADAFYFSSRSPVPRDISQYIDLTVAQTPRGSLKRMEQWVAYAKYQDCAPQGAGHSARQCAICLCSFTKRSACAVLRCAHLFHRACLRSWLRVGRECPMCRAGIAGGSA